MGLPKVDMPLFKATIPSTNQDIKFRPFTVKEEKNLLIAQESGDWDTIILSLQQLLNNCIVDDIDVESLAMFDIEFLMLQIRAKSINNVIEFRIKDPVTNDPIDLEFNIDKLDITYPEKNYKTIHVTDDYILQLRYPSIKEMYMAKSLRENNVETLFNMMIACIESVVNGDQIYKLSDFTDKDVIDFVDDLPKLAIDKLKDFFENMPKVTYNAEWETPEGEKRSVPLEGLENFFI